MDKKWRVGKHINDICLNPLEWLLDSNEDILFFDTKEDAILFLKDNGFTDDDIYWLTFIQE